LNSLRERRLQAVAGRLAPVAQAQGATFRRSPASGIPRDQSPALLLFPESDGIHERANDRVTRQLVVRIDALAREQGGVAPEDIAERLLVAAHAALFADPAHDYVQWLFPLREMSRVTPWTPVVDNEALAVMALS